MTRFTVGALAAGAAVAATQGSALAASLRIGAEPGLTPSFRTGVVDYVSRCGSGKPLRFSVDAPSGYEVGIDGATPRSGSFTKTVSLSAGQSTSIVVRTASKRTRHHVRCLPTSFPRFEFERPGQPAAQWYLFAPSSGDGKGPYTHHIVIMDRDGVPVWWRRAYPSPFNSTLFGDGRLAWTRWYGDPFGMRNESAWEIHTLDGTLVRALRTEGSPADTHDMQPLPNGNFLLLTYPFRRHVDLKPYGGSGTGAVFDGEIQEIDPNGAVVWSWNTRDHIEPSETTTKPLIQRGLPDGRSGFDVVHLNSVAPDRAGGLVVSMRHTDAVYRIELPGGKVTWKLGGTNVPGESLKVSGDPLSPTLTQQHDARVLPDGTITVYDNRSHVSPPRAVRFRVDAGAHTAKWLGQVTEPKVRSSGSEGSARMIGGHWVVSWGGSTVMSEWTGSSKLVWRLRFLHGVINYRLTPIPRGRLAATTLRQAMDRMFPRG